MKIKQYNNSFLEINTQNFTLLCDPWIGYAKDNAWMSYPLNFLTGKNLIKNTSPDYIYISHLHCDHFSPKTLKILKNKKVKYIIKKFKDSRLKNKLINIGIEKKSIIEIDEFTRFDLNNELAISIIPQIDNTNDGVQNQIVYDLDTSILIFDKKKKILFYNNVDNPININNFKKIKKLYQKLFKKKLDVTCFPVGAASEYPQCFMNINRKKEKERIEKSCINKTKKILEILKPRLFFPAGGTYTICGKYTDLSKYIAQPKFNKLEKNIKKICPVYLLEGGREILVENKIFSLKKPLISIQPKEKFYKKFRNLKYFYENKNSNITTLQTDRLFNKSIKNYFKILSKFDIKSTWKINIFIFKDLKLNKSKKIKKEYAEKKYSIISSKSIKKSSNTILDLYLDRNLFYKLMEKKLSWNVALSGSYIMFSRKPNIFDPNVTFSLNFLTK